MHPTHPSQNISLYTCIRHRIKIKYFNHHTALLSRIAGHHWDFRMTLRYAFMTSAYLFSYALGTERWRSMLLCMEPRFAFVLYSIMVSSLLALLTPQALRTTFTIRIRSKPNLIVS